MTEKIGRRGHRRILKGAAAASAALLAVLGGALALGLARGGLAHAEEEAPAALYRRNCALCHGAEGRGDGPAAYLLNPKPRNFRLGAFRLVSTANGIASEDDLVVTITRGMPGSAMPPWPQLTEGQRRQLARYVLGFRREELIASLVEDGASPEEAQGQADEALAPGEVINASPPQVHYPPGELKKAFVTLCASCHAEDGTGRDDPTWRTAEGYPITSRNFQEGAFKGGRGDLELYRRIAAGIPGTPMPAFGVLPPEQIWQMVGYIQSLSDPSAQEQAWIRPVALSARHVSRLPQGPGDGAWEQVPAAEVRLFSLWAEKGAVRRASVRAANDGTELALLVEWEDPEENSLTSSTTSFSDRVAVEFSTDPDPPLFAMGRPDRSVGIWQWAAASRSKEPPPERGLYYSDGGGWQASVKRTAEDPYLTAQAVGNPVFRAAAGATGYSAAGLGTLRAQKQDAESPTTAAAWSNGRWRVLFRRALLTRRSDDFDLDTDAASIAFAVWQGRLGERNGKKSVSIWGRINIERAGSHAN